MDARLEQQMASALEQQALAMVLEGVGRFDGIQRARQQRIELVGGGGDGTILRVGHQAPLRETFVARGEHEDGTGVERATYRKRTRSLHPAAAPVVDYVFEGLP